jgi:hypothetical protein
MLNPVNRSSLNAGGRYDSSRHFESNGAVNDDLDYDMAVNFTKVSRAELAQQEVLLLVHLNALRAAVATFPRNLAKCTKRQKRTIRKKLFLELFIESDPLSPWHEERLIKEWDRTPECLFDIASELLDPGYPPPSFFGGLRLMSI